MKPQKPRWLTALLSIAACTLITLLAVWDALAHHDGRLVYPMESYSFQPSDIPMLFAVALDSICILSLFIKAMFIQRKRAAGTNRTRKLNPKLGYLGFLGFLGFSGFWTWPVCQMYTPFCFFLFFGFFGFFFEGRMSNILMDERYRENAARAQLDAHRIGLSLIFLLMLAVAGPGEGRISSETALIILLAGISLSMALTIFLGVYLLYRYDQKGLEEQ